MSILQSLSFKNKIQDKSTSTNMEEALDEMLMRQDRRDIINRLVQMGNMTADMLSRSLVSATSNEDSDAEALFDNDNDVNRLELEIDWECMTSMAMRNPVHEKLRFLFAVFKMTTDLERIGDESCNIARHLLRHRSLLQSPEDLADVQFLLRLVIQQLNDVFKAFVESDFELARKVYNQDDVIDERYEQLYEKVLGDDYADDSDNPVTGNKNEKLRRQMFILTLARHLERVGDHIVNIAEYVCYLLTGEHINEKHNIEPRESNAK